MAGILVPAFKLASSTDVIPRSTAITHVYGNTQGFSLSVGGIAASTAQLDVICGSSSTIGHIIKAASSQSSDLLDLENSSGTVMSSFDANGNLNLAVPNLSLAGGFDTPFLNIGPGTLTGSGASPQFIRINSTFIEQSSPGFGIPPFVFQNVITTKVNTNAVTMNAPVSFYCADTRTADGVVWTGVDAFGNFDDNSTYSIANAGSFASMTHIGFRSNITVNSGTVNIRRGFYVIDGSGSGAITNQYGLVINNLTKGGTLNIPLYIQGTGSSGSRHIPKMMIGADSSPTTQLQIGAGEFSTHTSVVSFSGTISIDPTTGNSFTIASATSNATINATTGGTSGQFIWIKVTADNVSTHTMTFGTNFKPSGTHSTGGTSKTLSTLWWSDGSSFWELSVVNGL